MCVGLNSSLQTKYCNITCPFREIELTCCEFGLKSHMKKLRCLKQKENSNQYQSNLKQQQQ